MDAKVLDHHLDWRNLQELDMTPIYTITRVLYARIIIGSMVHWDQSSRKSYSNPEHISISKNVMGICTGTLDQSVGRLVTPPLIHIQFHTEYYISTFLIIYFP